MLSLELTDEQVVTLKEYLRRAVSNLGVEIAHTDRLEYRQALKGERARLHEVLDQLGDSNET